MSSPTYSRFTLRRRIIEVAIVLWVIAYFTGFFDKRQATPPVPPSAVIATPAQH